MGVPANPPPQARLPPKILNDDELRPYFTELQSNVYRLWLRSGGGTDEVSEITTEIEAIIERLDAIELRLDNIEAAIVEINERLDGAIQLIVELIADNAKLRARINTQDRQIKNANQSLADLQ